MVIEIIVYYFIGSFVIALVGAVIKVIVEEVKSARETKQTAHSIMESIRKEDTDYSLMESNLQKLTALRDRLKKSEE